MPGTEEAEPFISVNYPVLCDYHGKIIAAGGWAAYEKELRRNSTPGPGAY